MPRIPTVTAQLDARSGRTNNAVPNTRARAASFDTSDGGALGRALGDVASGLGQLGDAFEAQAAQQRQEDVANAVAQSDFTPTELEVRQEIGESGRGYRDRVLERYDAFVDEQANGIDDDFTRQEYRTRMARQRVSVSSRSAQYEARVGAIHSEAQANASLAGLQNRLVSDPLAFEELVQQGQEVIAARPGLTATARSEMMRTWEEDAANARFTGMLENATSVEEIDAIARELTGVDAGTDTEGQLRDWQSMLTPSNYETLLNNIGTARTSIMSQQDSIARAAIDTLEERAGSGVLIPTDELQRVQGLVRPSANPITIQRMARIQRDQDIIRETQRLTTQELQQQIRTVDGNPGLMYPGLPPRLSSAVGEAAQMFGVSASYLGATAQREYGQFLGAPQATRDANPEFAPLLAHEGVDLTNVRSDVRNAAAVAGELFGAPLTITSGYRSQARQDAIRAQGDPNRPTVARVSQHTSGMAIDVSTANMTAADRGRLVGALVDAGFTGIGEYSGHIHADFRDSVTATLDLDSEDAWGGWTRLSPEVAAALRDRGFTPGAAASSIARSRPMSTVDDVDYGQGTQIRDADGRPTSSALGVFQFTRGTFIDVMRDPAIAQRLSAHLGVDFASMSDDELLTHRADPRVATLAGAALADQNRRSLHATFNRQPNDAELYMAHFLGVGGATTLITATQNQPGIAAAELMPSAAQANRPVFFNEDGSARTVTEVYNAIQRDFTTQPSQIAYDDNQTRRQVLERTERGLETDPMAFASSVGVVQMGSLDDDNGFAIRGEQARSVADYYNIATTDMQPFTDDEVSTLSRTISEGDVDDVLEVMTAVQGMGGDMTRAALRQLDQTNSVFAFAAGLAYERQGGAVASDIVRGQRRIEENPAVIENSGATTSDVSATFASAVGQALNGVAPRQRQAIQDAAFAHYVETSLARGTSRNGQFDPDIFEQSINAVLGGTPGAPAYGSVNGVLTVLPPGVDEGTMEAALDNMSVDDWMRMGTEGLPPLYSTGEIVAPEDIADEGIMQALGGNEYAIMFPDGTYAVTGQPAQNSRVQKYTFIADADTINSVANRAEVSANTDMENGFAPEGLPPVDGVLSNFDENGFWIGPSE